jgi:hypothetical protein
MSRSSEFNGDDEQETLISFLGFDASSLALHLALSLSLSLPFLAPLGQSTVAAS